MWRSLFELPQSEKFKRLEKRRKKVVEAMPKLYFRHGAVSAAKSLNLLAVAHNYRVQGKDVLLMKPAVSALLIKNRATPIPPSFPMYLPILVHAPSVDMCNAGLSFFHIFYLL